MIQVKEFFDKDTSTLSYVVFDPKTKDGVVIDSVLNYEPASSKISLESVELVTGFIRAEGINLHFILETHAHADHLSGAQFLKTRFPKAVLAIGNGICQVQKTFSEILKLPNSFKTDGSQFDRLLKPQENFQAGSLKIQVIPTPGHTVACVSYLIEDCLFTGDALFMPDYGTGRCDFPGGSADTLYTSVGKTLYGFPDSYKVYTGHDYQPQGRALKFESSIGEEKQMNIQLKGTTQRADYVRFRTERDKTLSTPKLLFPSIQVNINAGVLPEADPKGRRFLEIPLFLDKGIS